MIDKSNSLGSKNSTSLDLVHDLDLPNEFDWSLLSFLKIPNSKLSLDTSEHSFRLPIEQVTELVNDIMIPEQRVVFKDLLEHKLFNSLANHLNSVDILSRDDLLKFRRREYLENHFNSLISSKTQFSYIMLDLDSFRLINKKYGHQVGDSVLRDLGDLIRFELRQSDVAYRYGGEEIGIILPETSLESGLYVAEKLRTSIENNLVIGFDKDVGIDNPTLDIMTTYNFKDSLRQAVCIDASITASFGITEYCGGDVSMASIVKHADFAMLNAKKAGKNRVCVAVE